MKQQLLEKYILLESLYYWRIKVLEKMRYWRNHSIGEKHKIYQIYQ